MPRTKKSDFDNYKYQQEYIKKNLKFVNVPFNSKFPDEMMLYDYLNAHAEKTGEKKGSFIKRLIREKMHEESWMKRYRIKPEYLDLWVGKEQTADPECIVTEDEVQRLAKEWERPAEELLEQLVEVD